MWVIRLFTLVALITLGVECRWDDDRPGVDDIYDRYVLEDPSVTPNDLDEGPVSLEDHFTSRILHRRQSPYSDSEKVWTGKWFPEDAHKEHENLKDAKHGIKMGVSSPHCDDAKVNLTMDWDMSPINYTCYMSRPYRVRPELEPELQCQDLPKEYVPLHFCMNQTISYEDTVPTHGDHRPLWPKFGEYKFVPVQRWLHNIEHGAIVMLYHPCAQPLEVRRLRKQVRSCIRKHIITPYTLLTPDRPLALVAWGCRLLMSSVDTDAVEEFITSHGLKGPEGRYAKEGQYDLGLLQLAKPPPGSDFMDSFLCPTHAS